MIKTVVFDLDDTLYDEIDYCRSGFRAAAEFLAGISADTSTNYVFGLLWDEFIAGNRQKTFNSAMEKLNLPCDRDMIIKLVELYRGHKPDISLPAESREILDLLSGQYSLALLTDGFLPAQKLKVEALGVEKYFKCIIYTEELGRECWKPSTVGFEKILEKLDADAKNAVYIADNEIKDFIGPNKLGFETIKLVRANQIHLEAGKTAIAMPEHTLNDIKDVPELLKNL